LLSVYKVKLAHELYMRSAHPSNWEPWQPLYWRCDVPISTSTFRHSTRVTLYSHIYILYIYIHIYILII